jgi:GalNAc-alpha-(1->4)-GalNAc-alpha-(1->3)-diNAcBac-PP-undecaprenol alpha-1,4-N-acetyl-D-galactosaminyltransferase
LYTNQYLLGSVESMNGNAKKRICLVIPSLHPGGMERVVAELANYFSTKPSIDLHLVLYGIQREIFYALPGNITIHRPDFIFNNSRRLLSSFKTLSFLRKKLTNLQATAILSFGEYWNSFVLLALIGKKLPVYISDRCQPDKNLGTKQEFLRKWLYPKANGIIAQTEAAKAIYRKRNLNQNIKVIGNPIRNIIADNTFQKEKIVLSVGRLIATKHHDELIRLFVKINQPDWKLVIVGSDALKQKNMVKLQMLIDDLNATDKVILAGKQSDVESYYRRSKIFAFTSSSEGFPNVIGEAQSAGLPVVAFDCVAGPSDMISDSENGFLIPLFDYELFQQKLSALMSDENLQISMGEAAKVSIIRFNVESIGTYFKNFILGEPA